MLKRLSAREKFEQLVADFEPLLRNAFLESIADIKSNIQIKHIVERLERNDIAGAIEPLYLDPAALRPLDRAIAQAYRRWRRCDCCGHAEGAGAKRRQTGRALRCSQLSGRNLDSRS